MRLRLAGGVVAAPDLAAWASAPSGPVRLAGEGDAPAGAAVALGPAGAGGAEVRRAVAELDGLVRAGGTVAAGAGVDLGGGFRSARLAGARGDQRDAVLAAVRVLGVEGAGRLGDRGGFLVALFGPAVTKRIGAAAARAIAEGRWAALHLASAASDVLGPEQLEQVLALTAPGGAEIAPDGPPSALAAHLEQVLGGLPRTRRLELLVDLWERVSEHHARRARRARLLATQARRERLDELRERREHLDDDLVLAALRASMNGAEPSLADAARWQVPDLYWRGLLDRLVRDALAATALLRTAVAVTDHGPEDGLARSLPVLEAADAQFPDSAAGVSARKVPGLTGLPARPGSHVRDILKRVRRDKGNDPGRLATHVASRLTHARDHALLIVERVERVLLGWLEVPEEPLHAWAGSDLGGWRHRVGFTAVRPPTDWVELPEWVGAMLGRGDSLAVRLAARPGATAAGVEVVGDLLWCADLADALARLHGHEAAAAQPARNPPPFDHDPPEPRAGPMDPRLDSITLAVSGAALLVSFGGTPVRAPRTWPEFIAGLRAGTAVAEALNGEFAVPAPLAAVDGALVPGTGARFRLARTARTLAEWANYMGNCIAGPAYSEAAVAGRCGLAALYDADGRILVNVDVRRARPALRGWRISEIAARFNDSPDPALEEALERWVATIPAAERTAAEGAVPSDTTFSGRVFSDSVFSDTVFSDTGPPAGPVRRRARPRLLEEVGPPLGRLARRAWNDQVTGEAARALAALASSPPGTHPDAALTRLRRLGPAPLAGACRSALGDGDLDLVELWDLTGIRPLESAVDGLDPAVRERFEQLALLLDDASLPAAMRRLARLPAVAPAYSMGLVARRVRASIGRLAGDGDPVLTRAVARRTSPPLLCALVVAATCRTPDGPTAPGGPAPTAPGDLASPAPSRLAPPRLAPIAPPRLAPIAPPRLAPIAPPRLAPIAPPRSVTVPGFPASTLDDPEGPWQRALPAARELGADTSEFWGRIAEHGLRAPAAWLGAGGWPALWSRAHASRRP